jgi:conjugal transfer pilus assembly protein TraV
MKQIKQIVILIYMMVLCGCSHLNSDFQCPMKPGVRCESLDQVDRQIDQGRIGKINNSVKSNFSNVQLVSATTPITPLPIYYKGDVRANCSKPLRYGETVMRVWVAPFEDTAGNYHQESDIYTVVKPAHWINYPFKESADEE